MDLKKLRQEVARTETTIDDKTLFLSPEFAGYAKPMAHSVAHVPNGTLSVSFDFDPKSQMTACTNGRSIYANFGHQVVQTYRSETSRFLAAMGMLFHECAHIRFHDHPQFEKRMEELIKGEFPVAPPPIKKGQEEAFAGIKAIMTHPVGRKILAKLVAEINNYIIDYHDEQCLIREEGAYVRYAIHAISEAVREFTWSLDTMLNNSVQDLAIVESLILQYARWKSFVIEDNELLTTDPHVQMVKEISSYLDVAMEADDVDTRFIQYNQCLLILWPLFKDVLNIPTPPNQGQGGEPDNSQSGGCADNRQRGESTSSHSESNTDSVDPDGQQPKVSDEKQSNSSQPSSNSFDPDDEQGQGNNDSSNAGGSQTNGSESSEGDDSLQGCDQMSQKDINQLIADIEKSIQEAGESVFNSLENAIDEGLSKMGKSKSPDSTSAKESGKDFTHANQNTGEYSDNSNDAKGDTLNAAEDALDTIRHRIAQRIASKKIDQSIYQSELVKIQDIPMGSSHKGQHIQVIDVPITDDLKLSYRKEMKDLKNLSRALQKKVKDAIKTRQLNETKHHRVYGRKLATRDLYRRDNRFFDQRKASGDPMDIAIAIIIDRSISMNSGSDDQYRIGAAVRAASLVYDFAKALHIPTMVVGHSYVGQNTSFLFLNATFDSRPGDEYRIMDQSTAGSNRDGLVINTVAELLSRRPEELKLLFVVSDGQPNADSYRGEPARKDIQQIVKKYKTKGVTTFATAIGSDKDMIREIYGDGYIDISDLKTFPQRLVRMIVKRII